MRLGVVQKRSGLRAVSAWLWLWLAAGCGPHSVSTKPSAPPAAKDRSRFLVRVDVRSSEALADYNFAGADLHAWGPRLHAALDRAFDKETTPRTIQIQITMHPVAEATIELSASPALPSDVADRITASFQNSAPPKTKLVDYTLRVTAQVGTGGPGGEASCEPKLLSPHDKRLDAMKRASIAQRLELLRAWSDQEVLPVLAAVMQAADPDFSGVRSIASSLATSQPHAVSVAVLLDKNPAYWRGLLEVTPGNPLLMSSRLFWHLSRGELDLVRLYLKPIYYFAKTDHLAHDYLEQLRDHLVLFYDSLDAQIRVGVALHDESRFDDAIALYESILRQYPCSALARYEQWFAKNARAQKAESAGQPGQIDASLDEWENRRGEIFRCNPMFEIDAVSRGDLEQKRMMRRLELRQLWKDRRVENQDYLRYAEIALDLGEYALAAHLYFLIGTGLPEKEFGDRKVLAHFLFSVEKLGVTSLKELFKGDHGRDFAEIQAASESRLRKSPTAAKRSGS